MLSYRPSETFHADQGLPNTTEVELSHETDFMYEFIALFVGDPISLWDLYKEYIKYPSRQLDARLTINGVVFDDEQIVEIILDETVNPDDSITLGSVASSKLDITIYDIPGTQYTDAKVYPEIGLNIDGEIAYLPLGEFTVDAVDRNKNRVNLTCFDNMIKLEKPYVSNLSYPASLNQVALEIAQMAGITLVTTLPNTFVDEIEGYTLRQAIGFVASFVGCFAKFNRDGDLEIISYRETDEMITADNYTDLQTPDNPFVIGKITCKVPSNDGDIELVTGIGGTGITFENPIMTQAQLDLIFDDLQHLTYMPFEIKWQGNPMLLAGDKVQITDINDQLYTSIVMDQQLRYTGGLSATSSAKGKSETAQEFDFKGSLKEEVSRIKQEQNERDPNITPSAPSSLTATGLYENVKLEWKFEDVRYIDVYEVYASQIAGFVPNESNLVWVGKSGSFNFFANVNERWYFRVRGVNTRGVAGPFSSQVNATTAQIKTADILFGAITSDLLADLAVTANKIAENGVTRGKIADNAINNAKLDDLAVTSRKIGDGAVVRDKIFDGAVGTAKLADLAVTTAKIRDAAINSAKIADLAVGNAAIQNAAITYSKIDELAVGTAHLQDAAITKAKIGEAAVGTIAIEDGAIDKFHLKDGIIENVHIADATIEYTKIKSVEADSITTGTLRSIDIIGTNIMSYNSATNDVITLENGVIETFEGGDKTFEVNAKGLSAFSRTTGELVGTFRSAIISGDASRRGLDIMGWSDYLSISRNIDNTISRTQLGFYWDGDYDRTTLYGGSGERDSGHLLLRSTSSGGTAGSRVPHLVIDNRTTGGTTYSGARLYVGRDNRSPSSSDFRSGFEVWQYTGNGNGGLNQLLKIDTNESGVTYSQFYTEQFGFYGDRIFVEGDYRSPGSIDIDGGITTGDTAHFYNELDMHNRDILNVGDIALSRIRANQTDGRFIELYNSYVTTNDVTYNGVALRRVNGFGGILFNTNHVILTGGISGSLGVLRVGYDSTSDLVQSTTIRDRSYSASANVYVTQNGVLGNVGSSKKHKYLIEPMKVNHYKILDIIPSDWYDKYGTDAYAHYLSNKDILNLDEEDIPYLRRIPGAVAEDFVDVGLDIYVTYNNDGEVQSLMYDRAWLSLVPITKDHEDRLNEYDNTFNVFDIKLTAHEQEINNLKDKVATLENEVEQLKGVA